MRRDHKLKIFENFNESCICPICKTNEDKQCLLIPIQDTNIDNSGVFKVKPIHLECLNLFIMNNPKNEKGDFIIYQYISGEDNNDI